MITAITPTHSHIIPFTVFPAKNQTKEKYPHRIQYHYLADLMHELLPAKPLLLKAHSLLMKLFSYIAFSCRYLTSIFLTTSSHPFAEIVTVMIPDSCPALTHAIASPSNVLQHLSK